MTTRDEVLSALRAAADRGASGEDIGRAIGVSRVAVAKHVAALRERGYDIEAVSGSGYRLRATPPHAQAEEVAFHLRDALWSLVGGAYETGSTNDDARALARAGAREGTVVVAAAQTAGRGRFDRTWHSPPGGAYVSAVLVPQMAPAEVGPLPLVVALGIAQGLATLGVDVELKWPNDIYLHGKKLVGILVEMSAESDRVSWVVAGFGLNVDRPADAPASAAYLSDVLPHANASVAAAAALDGLADAYRRWTGGGFAPLRPEYEARAMLSGRSVVVRDAMGGVRAQGVVAGIDDSGRLLIADGETTVPVVAGEVTLRD